MAYQLRGFAALPEGKTFLAPMAASSKHLMTPAPEVQRPWPPQVPVLKCITPSNDMPLDICIVLKNYMYIWRMNNKLSHL